MAPTGQPPLARTIVAAGVLNGLEPSHRLPCVSPPTDEPRPMAEESDWIEAAQKGDRTAFARLVETYWDRLFRWLFHMTHDRHQAEDLVQETFMKALAGIGSFRPGSNFRAWLFRIGHNNFVNLKRSEKRTRQSLPEDLASHGVEAITSVTDRESLATVSSALDELPAEFRAALLLHVQEGLSYREAAAILKTTEETARWRVFKARQKLMKVIAPELLPPAIQRNES